MILTEVLLQLAIGTWLVGRLMPKVQQIRDDRARFKAVKKYLASSNARIVEDVKSVNSIPKFPAADLTEGSVLPQNVLDYCEEESEAFAQDDCKARASRKFAESASWPHVLTSLAKEDGGF